MASSLVALLCFSTVSTVHAWSFGEGIGKDAADELSKGLEALGSGMGKIDPLAMQALLKQYVAALKDKDKLAELNAKLRESIAHAQENGQVLPVKLDLVSKGVPGVFRVWHDDKDYDTAARNGHVIAVAFRTPNQKDTLLVTAHALTAGEHRLYGTFTPNKRSAPTVPVLASVTVSREVDKAPQANNSFDITGPTGDSLAPREIPLPTIVLLYNSNN